MRTWDILISTIPHRHQQLCNLLATLNWQIIPGVTVIVFRDNTENPVGDKRQILLESATADYISFVDDDDMVPQNYVSRIMTALKEHPDYVGFPVSYFVDGVFQRNYEHSLRHQPGEFVRDLSHLNPMRREFALQGRFSGGFGEDGRWVGMVRESGMVKKEVWIPEVMYYYRYSTANSSHFTKSPLPQESVNPLPNYSWMITI